MEYRTIRLSFSVILTAVLISPLLTSRLCGALKTPSLWLGMYLRKNCACGAIRLAGMILPGEGAPLIGSVSALTPAKLSVRIAAGGGVSFENCCCPWFMRFLFAE